MNPRRTPLKRRAGLSRGRGLSLKAETYARDNLRRNSTLPRVGVKRIAENRVRRRVLAELRQEDPMCARCRVAPWVDGHELLRRSAGGSITDKAGIIGVCRACHTWIGEHPAQAIKDGWAQSRFGNQPIPAP